MRDLKNKLTSSKNSKNIQNRKGKSFGYQVLGFGAGGGGSPFLVATGGTETTSGNCKIHTFTGPGTFTVCAVSTEPTNNLVSYIVVAGGGGAGHGGGGGGGFREVVSPTAPYTGSPLDGYPTAPNRITVTATGFPITVGAAGALGPDTGTCQTSGGDSIFSTITSTGGGKGGSGSGGGQPNGVPTVNAKGETGGSGGGSGASGSSGVTVPGGLGNTPPESPAQGTNGGSGRFQYNSYGGGGGGGGAGGAGGCYSCGESITGGPGVVSNITASPVTYSRGGPSPATANSGNGSTVAGNSGIVVIRYKFQ